MTPPAIGTESFCRVCGSFIRFTRYGWGHCVPRRSDRHRATPAKEATNA